MMSVTSPVPHHLPRRNARSRPRQGAILVMVALLLPVMVILAGFTINMALLQLRKTELFVAADAAARAGGREMGMAKSSAEAVARAQQFAALNTVGGTPVDLQPGDIEFGQSTRNGLDRYVFDPQGVFKNAMRVTVSRDDSHAGGPVDLLFPMPGVDTSVPLSQTSVSTQVQVDIAIVVDRSGSMAYASDEIAKYPPAPKSAPPGWDFCDPAPPNSRWLDLVAAVDVFTQQLSQSATAELASLVTYADTALIEQPLTIDYALINLNLSKYTQRLCAGATNIGGGILAGMTSLTLGATQRHGAVKVIIVMTDGKHNTGIDPLVAAKTVAAQGIMIFSVTFSDEADQARMRAVAQEGQGKHFHASNGAELKDVFLEIAKQLPVLITE
ncbi:MAG: hypothetical protein KatS3mg111_2537 [Pirellulaceae bacterium]|nr:MAG: hypothetical protein KatS3mg111_2537 [Pirellulaceae bacterium]